MWATLVNQPSAEFSVSGSGAKDADRFLSSVTLKRDEPKEISGAMAEHLKTVNEAGRFIIVLTKRNPGSKPAVTWPVPDDAPKEKATG